MRFALSTAWNAQRHAGGRDIVEEIRALGIDKIELNFTLTKDIVREIHDLKGQGLIDVVGLHNFCPIPDGLPRSEASPDYFSLSSLDEAERKRAISQTCRTIDAAREIKAKVVIIHAGKVEMDQNPRALIKLYEKRAKETRYYEMVKKALVEERSLKEAKFLTHAIRSLTELSDYSRKSEVLLGIENRYHMHEIPSLDEMGVILDHFEGSNIFYWHDVGHAQVLENLGICKHKDYLDRFGAKMIGFHLHDVVGMDDHRAPGMGNFDFKILRPYLKEEILLVLEPHYPATRLQIKRAVKFLEKEFAYDD